MYIYIYIYTYLFISLSLSLSLCIYIYIYIITIAIPGILELEDTSARRSHSGSRCALARPGGRRAWPIGRPRPAFGHRFSAPAKTGYILAPTGTWPFSREF